jgi:intracellular multiplication protein IcmP
MTNQGNEDPTLHFLLFIAVLVGICWLVWHFFNSEILEMMRYLRLAELWLIGLVDHQARACFHWLRIAPTGNATPSPETYQAANSCFGADSLRQLPPVEALQYYNITPVSLGVITDLAVRYLRWIAGAACLGIGVYAMYLSPRNKFKTRYDLENFIKIQSRMWPIIAPIVNFIPSRTSARIPGDTVPDKLPVFAEALSPEEWISWHRIPVTNGIPERERVRRAFLLQLGPRWQGTANLPLPLLALFAAFALKGVQKRDEAEDLLGRLALSWTPEKGFVPPEELVVEVKKIAKDPSVGGEALKIASRHAYRTTALLGTLKWARYVGGVLAPAQFLWLRGVDRALWYPLNNLGRRSFHTEGAGALAHFMAEEAAGKPLPIPRIDTAIVALNQYLAANPVNIPPREEPKTLELPQPK